MIPPNFILFNLEKRVSEINERWLIDQLIDILIQNRYKLEDYNKNQLREGKKSDDSLFNNYSQTTLAIKSREGFDFNGHTRIQLFDKGDFHSGLFLSIYQDKIFFGSNDDKTQELQGRYGDNIFGLNTENLNIVVTSILEPQLIERVNETLLDI